MTVKEAALYAGVCESVIRGWLRDGLPHYRLGAKGKRGKIVIAAEDLDQLKANCKVSPVPPPVVTPPPKTPPLKHLTIS